MNLSSIDKNTFFDPCSVLIPHKYLLFVDSPEDGIVNGGKSLLKVNEILWYRSGPHFM